MPQGADGGPVVGIKRAHGSVIRWRSRLAKWMGPGVLGEGKGSGSFLEKRTKKLLALLPVAFGAVVASSVALRDKVFCFFLFTKRSLPSTHPPGGNAPWRDISYGFSAKTL
jgi:hypothetical protein